MFFIICFIPVVYRFVPRTVLLFVHGGAGSHVQETRLKSGAARGRTLRVGGLDNANRIRPGRRVGVRRGHEVADARRLDIRHEYRRMEEVVRAATGLPLIVKVLRAVAPHEGEAVTYRICVPRNGKGCRTWH